MEPALQLRDGIALYGGFAMTDHEQSQAGRCFSLYAHNA
jgi:hypothetical protein